MENRDRFKWIIKSMLDGYNLWDNDTDKPNDNCKPYDLLKNSHSDLWDSIQADQENPTAIQIWDFLNSKYSAKTVNSQMAALFNCCNMDISTNMDEALALHDRNRRALIAAFGSSINTESLANILFAQRLPKEYAIQVSIERAKDSFAFDKLQSALTTEWQRISNLPKANQTQKSNQLKSKTKTAQPDANTPTSANLVCATHGWDSTNKPCYGCTARNQKVVCR
jgi:hypothetical protein